MRYFDDATQGTFTCRAIHSRRKSGTGNCHLIKYIQISGNSLQKILILLKMSTILCKICGARDRSVCGECYRNGKNEFEYYMQFAGKDEKYSK